MPEVSPDVHSNFDPRTMRYVPVALWMIRHREEIGHTVSDVYGVLCSLYDPALGGAYPRQEVIAGYIGLSCRTVRRALVVLEDHGLIKRIRRGQGRSNLYEFLEHPWMHDDTLGRDHEELALIGQQLSTQEAEQEEAEEELERTPVVLSNDNLQTKESTPVLRTGRRALRAAAPNPDRRKIQAVADGDFGEVDAPALGADPDVPEIVEQTTRKRSKRQRPADPADWNALELGEYFVAQCGKVATAGQPLMESFVGVGSAKAVASHARKWMDSGVAPAQIKLDVDHFVGNYGSYRIKGVKPDRAFLAQIAGIREKTLRQSAYDADDAFVMKTQPARRSPYASA